MITYLNADNKNMVASVFSQTSRKFVFHEVNIVVNGGSTVVAIIVTQLTHNNCQKRHSDMLWNF